MPKPPSRLKGKGRFPIEWNLINDWFKALASTWFRSDGTIKLEVNQDHLLLGVNEFEIIMPVMALEDIANGDEGECSTLLWHDGNKDYKLEQRGIPGKRIIVRNDYNADITSGDEFLAGLTLDGNWEAMVGGGGTIIELGTLDAIMNKGETANATSDSGESRSIKDPGQIQRAIQLNAGNRVTYTVGDPGILISYDCDETSASGQQPPGPPPQGCRTAILDNGTDWNTCPPVTDMMWQGNGDPAFISTLNSLIAMHGQITKSTISFYFDGVDHRGQTYFIHADSTVSGFVSIVISAFPPL